MNKCPISWFDWEEEEKETEWGNRSPSHVRRETVFDGMIWKRKRDICRMKEM